MLDPQEIRKERQERIKKAEIKKWKQERKKLKEYSNGY